MTGSLPRPSGVSDEAIPLRYRWERRIREARLGVRPTLVGLALSTYASNDGADVYPSLNRVALGIGVSENFVRAGRTDLVGRGWLVLVERRYDANGTRKPDVYRLAIPAGGDTSPEGVAPLTTKGAIPHEVTDTAAPHGGWSLTRSGEQVQEQAQTQSHLQPQETAADGWPDVTDAAALMPGTSDPHHGYPCPEDGGDPCRESACPSFSGAELEPVSFGIEVIDEDESGLGRLTLAQRHERNLQQRRERDRESGPAAYVSRYAMGT